MWRHVYVSHARTAMPHRPFPVPQCIGGGSGTEVALAAMSDIVKNTMRPLRPPPPPPIVDAPLSSDDGDDVPAAAEEPLRAPAEYAEWIAYLARAEDMALKARAEFRSTNPYLVIDTLCGTCGLDTMAGRRRFCDALDRVVVPGNGEGLNAPDGEYVANAVRYAEEENYLGEEGLHPFFARVPLQFLLECLIQAGSWDHTSFCTQNGRPSADGSILAFAYDPQSVDDLYACVRKEFLAMRSANEILLEGIAPREDWTHRDVGALVCLYVRHAVAHAVATRTYERVDGVRLTQLLRRAMAVYLAYHTAMVQFILGCGPCQRDTVARYVREADLAKGTVKVKVLR